MKEASLVRKGGQCGRIGGLKMRLTIVSVCLERFRCFEIIPTPKMRHECGCAQAWENLSKAKEALEGPLGRIVTNQCLRRIRDQKPQISVDEIFDSRKLRLELIDQRFSPESGGHKQLSRVLFKEIHSYCGRFSSCATCVKWPPERRGNGIGNQRTCCQSRLTRARCELKQRLDKVERDSQERRRAPALPAREPAAGRPTC